MVPFFHGNIRVVSLTLDSGKVYNKHANEVEGYNPGFRKNPVDERIYQRD